MKIKLDKEYEVKCTLGTIKEIENLFNKPFFAIASALDKLTTTEQLKLLFMGVKRADSTVREDDFMTACDDYLGIGDLTDCLEEFILQLQYPGSTKEEIEKKIEKKLQVAERVKASTGAR